MLLIICSAHKSLWHQGQSQLMQGIHLSKSREAKQIDTVLGLCCVPGYLLCWSSIKPNCLPSLPSRPFTSSQPVLPLVLRPWFATFKLCFPLYFLYSLRSNCEGLLSPLSYFLLVDLSAAQAPRSKDCLTMSLCSAHHTNIPIQSRWAPLVLLPHGCNKVILAPAADTVSEGPAEIKAHVGPTWW